MSTATCALFRSATLRSGFRRLIGRLELWQAKPEAQSPGVDKTS